MSDHKINSGGTAVQKIADLRAKLAMLDVLDALNAALDALAALDATLTDGSP